MNTLKQIQEKIIESHGEPNIPVDPSLILKHISQRVKECGNGYKTAEIERKGMDYPFNPNEGDVPQYFLAYFIEQLGVSRETLRNAIGDNLVRRLCA